MRNKILKKEYLALGAVLLVFFCMALYKLTDTPLWYDEMIEFYYSKYLTGPIRGVSLCGSLYERLQANSFQPPLYNLVMHVWLLFGESEWWFRFNGVLFGLAGMLGLYACVRQFAGWQAAALSVFVSSFVYEWMYYVKEAAEYNMMIMLLYWLLYLYFRSFRNLTMKNILWFTAVSVVLLYTQYGAVLGILPLAVSLFARAWTLREKKLCRNIAFTYGIAAAAAGLPLYFLLFRIQLQMNQSVNYYTVAFEKGNVIYDFFLMLLTTAQWLFTESKTRFLLPFALALPAAALIAVLFIRFRKNKEFNFFLVSCIAVWLIYYAIVRAGIYAYGDFGNRYSLFLFPIWSVLIVYLFSEFFALLRMWGLPEGMPFGKRAALGRLVYRSALGLFLAVQLGYCAYGFYRISIFDVKSDTRSVVRLWYELEGYEAPTYVVFGEAPSFTYYLTHDNRFREEYWDDIVFEYENVENSYSPEEYWEFFLAAWNGQPPEHFYLSIGHENTLTEALRDQGYVLEEKFLTNTILFEVSKEGE